MRLEKGGAAAGRAARWGWKYKWTIAGGVGILIMVMLMLWIYVQKPLNRVEVVLVNNLLIPLPIALLYFGLIREKTIVARALSGKLMRILGRSSYSFYLLHTIIIDYVSVPRLSTLFGGHRVVAVLLTFVVTWGISILLYMFYEEPLNRWIRGRFIPKRRLAVA
jgi:peptidoglycan/LPS O-acetylase OafA/YrhL